MRVRLVTMPWQTLEMPSLPLTLIRQAAIANAASAPVVTEWYGNLSWAEFLFDVSGGSITPTEYNYVADTGLFHGMGDWIFEHVLNGTWPDGRGPQQYLDYLARSEADPGRCVEMREFAAAFAAIAAREILASEPDVVGFTTTFGQNVASLATARLVKELAPDVRIVSGGGNCDGEMGTALHQAFPFVDHVVRGEGELVFPQLLDAIAADHGYELIPSLCWRDPDANRHVNSARPPLTPLRDAPVPDYVDWFTRFDASPLRDHLEPRLKVVPQ
jgi:hypothetical protein